MVSEPIDQATIIYIHATNPISVGLEGVYRKITTFDESL